ncbi:hypothetical protein OG21DRAFT_415032 [Imleria badia]|nr:hypothetical protein OG21DRAFT_415032 [Imleria badia]
MPPPAPPPMQAYDSASSSSSASSSTRHRLMRKRSPSPPHVHHFAPSPRPYSPSSREADIARLLDPAYASPAPYSPLSKSPRMTVKEVYVDHHGDLHDPDFRDFPPFGHPSRRPQWERAYGDEGDSDDEEPQVEQRRPSFEPQRPRPSSSITYHPPPVYYPYEEPASYESRYLAEDEDEEGEQLEDTPLKEKSFCRRPRSPTKRPKVQDEKHSTEGDQVIQADSEWT